MPFTLGRILRVIVALTRNSLISLYWRAVGLLRAWYWDVVLVPFLITRLVYLLVAWFANYYFPFDHLYASRGYFLTPYWLIDIWNRWDSAHYFSIVTGGYVPSADLAQLSSNVAFFPLYPYLVRVIGFVFPGGQPPLSLYLAFGLLISNVSFLVGAGLLYKLIVEHVADHTVARRTLLLQYAFPTSFIFSSFYTEGLFFLLSVVSVTLALKGRWFWACLAAALLSVTRPQGILIVIPLVWLYLKSCEWNWRRIRPDLAWQAIIPIPVVLHFISLYPKTGSWWAPLLAQQAWGRTGNLFADISEAFTSGIKPGQIDYLVALLFLAITVIGIWRFRSRALGAYALAQIVLPAATGSLGSFTRFAVTIFPVFIFFAGMLKRRSLQMLTLGVFFAFQVVYFLGWVNYYWID